MLPIHFQKCQHQFDYLLWSADAGISKKNSMFVMVILFPAPLLELIGNFQTSLFSMFTNDNIVWDNKGYPSIAFPLIASNGFFLFQNFIRKMCILFFPKLNTL